MDDKSPAHLDHQDALTAGLAQRLLDAISSATYTERSENGTLDVAALWNILRVVQGAGSAIQSLINTTLPVNRLPPEVLGHVFSFIPELCYHPILDTYSTNVQDVKPLLPVLQVCRRWREIACSAPSLWTSALWLPDGRSATYQPTHQMHQDYIHLCPALPIYVAFDTEGIPRRFWDLLLVEGVRIRELHIAVHDSGVMPPDVLRLSLPMLERCTIDQEPPDSPTTSVIQAVFPDSTSLQALRLWSTEFVPSTAFPILTTLHLIDIAGVRLADLLGLLSGAPQLRDIQLDWISPKASDAAQLGGWRGGRIPFDNLQRLVVQDKTPSDPGSDEAAALVEYQRGLLSSISIPATCRLSIEGVVGVSNVAGLLDLVWPNLQRYAQHLQISGNDLPSHLTTPGPLGLLWRPFVLHLLNREDGLDVSFGIFEPRSYDAAPNFTRTRLAGTLATVHTFSRIRKLWIVKPLGWLVEDLSSVVAALPCAVFIGTNSHLWEMYSDALIAALQPVGPSGNVIAPLLSTLAYKDAHWRPDRASHRCGDAGEGPVHDMQRARAAAGHPLRRLIRASETNSTAYEYDAEGVLVRVEDSAHAFADLREEWLEGLTPRSHDGLISRHETW